MTDICKYFLPNEDLIELKEYLKIDREINMDVFGDKSGLCYLKDILPTPSNIDECKSCECRRNNSVILHTHPSTYLPHPSLEDLNHVVKNNDVRNSIVITSWGVWQIIKNGDKTSDLNDKNKSEFVNQCFERMKNGTSTDWNNKYLDNINKYMSRVNEQLLSRYGVKLYFNDWDDVEKNQKFLVK
jgi:hypothetical protein